ncbi:DinB family protein [uncultured Algibacter sp.]|uniref:DinB family protein n=1 Tax=uncultured Algibacter sp. TaxID=298659 RepID=UPI0026245702|nr:DinB family protein [uncultured Algibacter sp.]
MYTDTLIKIFQRDLVKLKVELEAYTNEEKLWLLPKGINNSAGNLGLHIVGNLNHFVGATLGNTGYVRKRDLEFSQKNVSRNVILKQIDETIEVIETTLLKLTPDDFAKQYPLIVFKEAMSTEFFLTHLITHLSYHLGQINYHRRLLDE